MHDRSHQSQQRAQATNEPMNERIEKHIDITTPGLTAIEALAGQTALSKQQLKNAMTNGAVWLEDRHGIRRLRRAKKELQQGDRLHLYYNGRIQSQRPAAALLVADEGDYSVWNKPFGLYSQGSKWGDHCTVYRWAEQHLLPQRPAYPVHRLDRAASGLILLAHNKQSATAFLQLFRQHGITKHYRVVVAGRLVPDALPMPVDQPLDGKPAQTLVLESAHNPDQDTTTLRVAISTGRKHQIRRHLSMLGHAVVGDRLYGAGPSTANLQLQSVLLSFSCPSTGRLRRYTLLD